jgi:hypothetical protein
MAGFDDARYQIDQDVNRFQGSDSSRGVGLPRGAHMISSVRIRGRGIECFGGNSDDGAACVAQAIVADGADH